MSDSEGSLASLHGSEKSVTCDETVQAMPTQQNQNGDKLEEFEKLLQSMIVSRSPSEEEEQVEEEDNANERRTVGRPSYSDNHVNVYVVCAEINNVGVVRCKFPLQRVQDLAHFAYIVLCSGRFSPSLRLSSDVLTKDTTTLHISSDISRVRYTSPR